MNLLEIKILCCGAAAIAFVIAVKWICNHQCFFGNHKMKHLSIEIRVFPSGYCGRAGHPLHEIPCYVTRWVCDHPGCGEMGFFCVGSRNVGAWTIRNGEIVPDEKQWMKWD